jgi:DNA-binding transcriptional LysR family regulator
MQDWNDLRFFLAIAEHGSTLAASAVCGTSQSTVFRRIAVLEQDLGVPLFHRRTSGYVLTSAGEALLPLARTIKAEVSRFEEAAACEQRQQVTAVRFSAPEVALEYLLPTIAAFRTSNAGVQVELVSSDRRLDLATGEADVALRTSPTSAEAGLFGRRLCYERPQLVASRSYAARHALPLSDAEVRDHDFVGLIGNLAALLSDWLERNVPRERIILQPNSMGSTLSAVRAGLGISVLPQFLCDREPDLVAAPLTLPVPTFEMWIVSHERSRGNIVVRGLMDEVARYIANTSTSR